MSPEQIAALAGSVNAYAAAGLTLIGGVRALVGLFHTSYTDAELDAIVDAVMADAAQRVKDRSGIDPALPDDVS